jgi:glycosyltransferase involved in cell wall biosynthesis
MSDPLPIFIISFNRGDFLRRTIQSYLRQTMPVEIIVHDNGSDDPETLAILADLAQQGISIHRHRAITSPAELDLVDETIDKYFAGSTARGRYAVTDCDVDLTSARPDALQVYDYLLDRFAQADCVGPMLTIADIPENYPLFNRVMNRHIEQFWHQNPQMISTPFGDCAFIEATIDTTFAIHREGSRFRRLRTGLRVYHPFEASHLDWYPRPVQGHYHRSSCGAISHWDNAAQFAAFSHEALRYDRYKIVVEGEDGGLIVRCRELSARTDRA